MPRFEILSYHAMKCRLYMRPELFLQDYLNFYSQRKLSAGLDERLVLGKSFLVLDNLGKIVLTKLGIIG
jgi:hypothetical protein